jgi:nucleoside-diphosphate-sugar epimerase
MRIVVTGGSGKLGRATVAELVAHGHEVWNVDLVPALDSGARFTRVDLTDMGQVYELFRGIDEGWDRVDGLVHLAAVPGPAQVPNAALFANNIRGSYNVFAASRHAGIRNIVWASSETVLGLPFDTPPPYIPLDEEYAVRPETAYSLAKALEHDATGMEVFIIANADTVMSRSSADLAAEVFPGVPVRKSLGTNETLLSIDKARRVLGYEPRHSWREAVPTDA